MSDEQTNNIAAILAALRDLRVSAQVSLSVVTASTIMLLASLSDRVIAFAPSIVGMRGWLLLAVVIGAAFFVIGLAIDRVKARREKSVVEWSKRARSRERATLLTHLTITEQNKLRPFLVAGSRVDYASANDPIAMLLVKRQVLEIVGEPQQVGSRDMPQQFHMQLADWAWDYLREHPEVLGLRKENLAPVGDEISRVRNITMKD
jgi:hypothetical protein